jgi:TolB-like protein
VRREIARDVIAALSKRRSPLVLARNATIVFSTPNTR